MTEVRPQRKSRFRVLRTLVLGGLALLVLAVTGAYVFRERISRELNSRLAAQMRGRGIHVDYIASDFAPFKGVKLSDIRLYRDASREVTVATLSTAELHFSLLGLLRDRTASRLRITSADAMLELAGDSGSYSIGNLAIDLLIDRQGTNIKTFRGTVRDLEFALDGDFAWRSFAKAEEADRLETAPRRIDPTTRVIDLSPVARWLELIPDSADGEIGLDLTLSRPVDPAAFSLSGKLAGKRVNSEGDRGARRGL